MEPRTRKNRKEQKDFSNSSLSYGVANMEAKPMDKGYSKFIDFLAQVFLFFLGGIILCGMLYALITFT